MSVIGDRGCELGMLSVICRIVDVTFRVAGGEYAIAGAESWSAGV